MSDQQEFTPRNYQVELMKIALKQNTIIFLPTGSGKTFIALMVLKQMGESLLKSYSEGGKLTIILVNTVALVDQHASYIINHTNFDVGKYTGEMNLDFWPKYKWYDEYEKYQVIIMTSQILVNLVHNSFIDLNKVNLLIFDECHRGVNDHCMRQLMKAFQSLNDPPRVLGLTATLLNGNCKPDRVMHEVKVLETTYQSKVATVAELQDVVGYSTNPRERVTPFSNHNITEVECFSINMLKNTVDVLQSLKAAAIPVVLSLKGLRPLDAKEGEKKVANLINDLIYHIETLGLYGSYKACLAHTIQIERLKKHCDDLRLLTILNCVETSLTFIGEKFQQHMNGYEERQQISKFSSSQILLLINIFREYRQISKEDLCCIVFTKRRFTAKVIFYILDSLSKCDPEFSYLKANFMVGHNNNPYNDTRESLYVHKQNKQVLDSFANKEINVLVASNVLEEGVDIPKCTLVIKYDHPEDYRSYIQSKGRARHKESLYYMMVSNEHYSKFKIKYHEFGKVEGILNDYLIGKNDEREEPSQDEIDAMYNEDEIPPYYVDGPKSAQVNLRSAIPLLCQYCASLPSDMYTVHAPDWYVGSTDDGVNVVILLPVICKILDKIEGPAMPYTKLAKRAAALKACITLHQAGELDDHLLPRKFTVKEEDINFLFTHYPKDKDPFAGSLKSRRLHKKLLPRIIQKQILPNSTVYVHVIDVQPAFRRADIDINQSTLYDMYTSPLCFGVVTRSPLPTLCDFPIYVTLGTINISIKVNQNTETITHKDLDDIKSFHVGVFKDVLNILQKFLVFDKGTDPEMMLVVPINKHKNTIDWDVLRSQLEVKAISEISIEEKLNLEVSQEGYLKKIVSPWYRGAPATYIVTEVCLNKNANSPFPNEDYSSFVNYFKERHNLVLRNPNLPLLLVKGLTRSLSFMKPKGKASTKRKYDKIHVELEEYLPAELVIKQEYPSSLWIQARFLPTILSRISFMLQLEQLRYRIAKEKHMGQLFVDVRKPLQLDEYLLDYEAYEEDDSTSELSLMETDVTPALLNGTVRINKDFSNKILESQYPWKTIEEPLDIERNLDISVMDIEHYEAFVGKQINESRELKNDPIRKKEKQLALTYHKNFVPVKIKLLETATKNEGPELCELYRAFTAAKSNDIVNLERLETLGDSFLKLITSVYISLRFPQYEEGRATELKGRLVSNRNLYYLALKKKLNGIMKYNELSPENEWLPPGFAIPTEMLQRIDDKKISITALFGLQISSEEQISGELTEMTKADILDDECPITDSEECSYQTMAQFFKSQYYSDKHLADTVESLIGVYFKTYGFKGGILLLEWLGLIPQEENLEGLIKQPSPDPLLVRDDFHKKIRIHLPLHREIEEIIGYTFKNKAYLLQAMTHSSYTPNRSTLSYEKLEFLGDAVLDFLITCHIYESCERLDPGKLTDLRSALVNNNTFASLVVKLGLHKYLLMINCKLQKLVDKFVAFMEQKNYIIDDEVMILLQEDDYQLAECVDVPKILGDVFEAIAGAIYLDCNKDLNIVWDVFYKIMWKEIDAFSRNVPMNIIRKLFEWNGAHPKFGKPVATANNKTMVSLQFLHGGIPTLVHGFGTNKAMAKKAAAKLALNSLTFVR